MEQLTRLGSFTLYKKAGQKVQQWTIEVEEGRFRTTSGFVGGSLVTNNWTNVSPKNVGKSNETTLREQAISEAAAKFTKKVEEGYTINTNGVSDVEVWLEPMLAYDIAKKPKVVVANGTYLIEPKLDGLRCIGTWEEPGVHNMFSRKGKPFTSCPTIAVEVNDLLERIYECYNELPRLDGELYNHEYKENFPALCSLIKKSQPLSPENEQKVQYWLYDLDMKDTNSFARYNILQSFLDPGGEYYVEGRYKHLKLVPAVLLTFPTLPMILDRINELQGQWVEEGYEGAMVRVMEAQYYNRRTDQLLKVKTFDDGEFIIKEVLEGQGNREGMAGKLVVLLPATQQECEAGISGGVEFYKELWAKRNELVGRTATIRYFGYTPAGKLRFPVVKYVDREGLEG